MKSSRSRSRSKNSRNRQPQSGGNVVNRVFDSSGPEGKVRGTPQQVIEKYNQLARDAQLSNDRVAAENFQQHAEHYLRMLSEAQREMDQRREEQERQQRERQEEQDRQNRERQAERDRERAERQERDAANGGPSHEGDANGADQPSTQASDGDQRQQPAQDSGDAPKRRRSSNRHPKQPDALRARMRRKLVMTATAIWSRHPRASQNPAVRPVANHSPRLMMRRTRHRTRVATTRKRLNKAPWILSKRPRNLRGLFRFTIES